MASRSPRLVVVHAPATVGNFGPGFDSISLALHGLGDTLELHASDSDSISVEGPGAEDIPNAWSRNVAGVTLDALRQRTGVKDRLALAMHKRVPGGSGLGSSASSAGGAALAFHALFRRAKLTPEALVLAAGEGEGVAAGRHYDDVAAVVLGGLAIIRVRDGGVHLGRVQPPRNLHLAVVAPRFSLPTRQMRKILPAVVARADAIQNLGNVAALIDAFHRGDVETIGACLDDRIAAPVRSPRIVFFNDVRDAALKEGAYGAAISGSGPGMFAVCGSKRNAATVASSMQAAVEAHRIPAEAIAARPEMEVMHRAVTLR